MTRALTVWWEGAVVGSLALDADGQMRFTYAEEWLAGEHSPALSCSLPKRREPFHRRRCRPFFEGLLPEGIQREAVAAVLGVSPDDEFGLLERLGGDVAGALTLWPEAETPPLHEAQEQTNALSDEGLVALLDSLPARPFLAGTEGRLRLSLAGAQSKMPVVLVGNQVGIPAPGQPTTHILKPAVDHFPATVENEAFAMRLAAGLGLSVAAVEPRSVAGRPYLVVERYDRRTGADGRVRRLHQEDFCQALGLLPHRKYAADGGPTAEHCFALVRRACSRPAVEVLKLLDAFIVQALIGNADAHAKNYSLLYRGATVELAPLYDVLSTVAYPELDRGFAMRIGGRRTLAELRAGDWDRFARTAGLGAPFVSRRVRELAERALEGADAVAAALSLPGLSDEVLAGCATRAAERAQRLAGTGTAR